MKLLEDGYILIINKKNLSDVITDDMIRKEELDPSCQIDIQEIDTSNDQLEMKISVYQKVLH